MVPAEFPEFTELTEFREFNPRKLPTVLYADELIDKAFRRASKVSGRNQREKAINKLSTVSNVLSDYFQRIISSHPSYDNLPEFYREMVDVVVGIRRLKKSLAALKWADEMTQKLINRYLRKLKGTRNPEQVLKEAYGRIASVIEQIDDELRFLNEAKQKMREIPTLRNMPTVVVAGYPNVGKSSFVAAVSSVKPEVASYPFTTKAIYVGYAEIGGRKVQFIDTPGLLDRPLSKRNVIERRAILCLRYAANCILFIADPTETCGYPFKKQKRLLGEVRRTFDIPIIVAYSKADLHNLRDNPAFSTVTGEGIDEVLSLIEKVLDEVLDKETQEVSDDSTAIQEG
jgi:nucleolar GTP-binding protein